MKHEFYRQTFEKKYTNIKFIKNPCGKNQVVPCVGAHISSKTNSRFSQFANAPKNGFLEYLNTRYEDFAHLSNR